MIMCLVNNYYSNFQLMKIVTRIRCLLISTLSFYISRKRVCAELRQEFHLAIGGSLTHGERETAHTLPMISLKRKGGGGGRSPVHSWVLVAADLLFILLGGTVMADLPFNIEGVGSS